MSSTIPNPSSLPAGEIRDGVQRLPVTDIRVLIVGAGLGGLLAALECWRKGHSVVILEKTPDMSPLGDSISIGPSAISTFKYYPNMVAEYKEKVHTPMLSTYAHNGDLLNREEPEWKGNNREEDREFHWIGATVSRAEIAAMLYSQTKRLGIPTVFGHKAVQYGENIKNGVGWVETASGDIFEADVVIAADAVYSKSFALISADQSRNQLQYSGLSIARTGFSKSDIASGSLAETLFPEEGQRDQIRFYFGIKSYLVVDLTPRNAAWAWHFLQDDRKSEEELCRLSTIEEVMGNMEEHGGWDPAVMDLISQTPGKVVYGNLETRKVWREWTSPGGRMIQIGDAAHPFMPTTGNGGAQSIEDAISIAECLRQGGRQSVPWSTKVHNTLRYQRVSTVQRTGFVNQDVACNADLDAMRRDPDKAHVYWGRWIWSHKPEVYAAEKFDEALAAMVEGREFENTNLPPGHKWEEWTLEQEFERLRNSDRSDLHENGYWGNK